MKMQALNKVESVQRKYKPKISSVRITCPCISAFQSQKESKSTRRMQCLNFHVFVPKPELQFRGVKV